MSNDIAGYLIIGLGMAQLFVSYRVRLNPVFALVLLSRWVRWILFGLGMAYLAREWVGSTRAYWSLAPMFLLLWILLESIYAWLAVKALSLSNLPVFPNYRSSSGDIGWPVEKGYLAAKDEIKRLGFSLREKMKASLGPQMDLQSALYLDESETIRLQVVFAPRATGRPALFFILSSKSEECRWATDNVWLPFGGVFPENWKVDRNPFTRRLKSLFKKHLRTIAKEGATLEKFNEDLVDELNDEQDKLDKESTERGVLFPRRQRPEFGKLTVDGRYRVWKQILLLNYLGRIV